MGSLNARTGGIVSIYQRLFQTYGLKYTTASKNAFITTLYVVIVPFLAWAVNHVPEGK